MFAQAKPPVFYDPANNPTASSVRRSPPQPKASTLESGQLCQTATFEGIAEFTQVPNFDGIAFPGWAAGIGKFEGGHANFVNEPSPVTVAVWLGGSTSQITFTDPVSTIEYYYATAYPSTVTAYDAAGNIIVSGVAPPNWTGGGVYDLWTPIQIQSGAGNIIKRLTLSGITNFLGIDNFKACSSVLVDTVEITQAIQQLQTLSDLESSLSTKGEPPVPIIAGKPGVFRVYMQEADSSATIVLHLAVTSGTSGTVLDQYVGKTIQPHCVTADQRSGAQGCQSTDFYFTPPTGSWSALLEVIDPATSTVLETHTLPVTSRTTQTLRVRSVSVCDARDASQKWLCAPASKLLGGTGFLAKIAPTNNVTLDITPNVVKREVSSEPDDGTWWADIDTDINKFYKLFDKATDVLLNQRTEYHGMVRSNVAGGIGGRAFDIPGNAAASRASTLRLGQDIWPETFAHETGHSLGLKHTNTNVPVANGTPPGCYNFASDSSTDWPFADNTIQSLTGPEYGFDVAARKIIDPAVTYELMSYCTPRWTTPQRYKTMIATLGGGAVTSPSAPTRRNAGTTSGSFWLVSGKIPVGGPIFDPVFVLAVPGDTSGGSGTYSLEVQDAGGTPLFIQHFTPGTAPTETILPDVRSDPRFSELIPVTPGAARIVLKNPSNIVLGTITLGGTPPTVTVTTPGTGFVGTGVQTIAWTITDPDSSVFWSKVFYSADNGGHWSQIGEVPASGTTLNVDFGTLPGTNGQGLIQVLVSDGTNTGVGTSPAFTVPKGPPNAIAIDTPAQNSAQPAAQAVFLSGHAYDPDDGSLTGTALQWSSNIQGVLGTGTSLSVNLNPGTHVITLKATDSDGNFITTTVNVTVGGAPPVVTLNFTILNPPPAPATCVQSSISAAPGANGAPLASVQYSLNDGLLYQTVPASLLPYVFIVPGSGFIHIVARATDITGQTTTQDSSFFINSPCSLVSDLTITSAHAGNFSQGQVGAQYTLTVTNSGSAATNGAVTVTDSLPAGLTATAVTGPGWSCTVSPVSCTRPDALGVGASYPPITVTLNVAANAPASVINVVSVVGGSEVNTLNSGAADTTIINQISPATVTPAAGTPQNAPLNTAFLAPFRVKVTNGASAPVSGVTVTFTAPASGPSGTFAGTNTNVGTGITDPSGIATAPVFTANAIAGNYSVIGSVPGAANATFALTNSVAVAPTTDSAIDAISGSTHVLTLKYSSAGGFANITDAYALLNGSFLTPKACFAFYDKSVNGFFLVNDAGTGLLGPVLPGVGSQSNSQCTLNGAGSSVSGLGATLTVTLNLTFLPGFNASESVYMYAADGGGLNSGWNYRGTTSALASTAPTADSALVSGTAPNYSLTLQYSSANGFGYLSDAYVLINGTFTSLNACWAFYDKASDAFYLVNNSGSALLGPLARGSAGTLSNSQCTLNGTGSTVSGAGNALTVTLNLTFSATFGGAQTIYMYAADQGAQNTGWVNKGPLTTISNAPPTADSVSVASSGGNKILTLQYSSANGYPYLSDAYVLVNSSSQVVNSCFIFYDRAANGFYLVNDTTTALVGPVLPGAGSASNGQCTLNGVGSSVSGSGNALTLTLNVTFKAAFAGPKSVYMFAADQGGMNSGWQTKGQLLAP